MVKKKIDENWERKIRNFIEREMKWKNTLNPITLLYVPIFNQGNNRNTCFFFFIPFITWKQVDYKGNYYKKCYPYILKSSNMQSMRYFLKFSFSFLENCFEEFSLKSRVFKEILIQYDLNKQISWSI